MDLHSFKGAAAKRKQAQKFFGALFETKLAGAEETRKRQK